MYGRESEKYRIQEYGRINKQIPFEKTRENAIELGSVKGKKKRTF